MKAEVGMVEKCGRQSRLRSEASAFAGQLPASLASYAGTRRRDKTPRQGRFPWEVLADCQLALPLKPP
jgi:hypothetical protein